jgi:polyketide cyclase/dehydrase/lipid transport protein
VLEGLKGLLWQPSVTDVERVAGTSSGVGAVYKQGLNWPGDNRRIAGDYTVTQCTPHELIVLQVIAGPARPTGTYRFEATGGGTRVTFILEYRPKGVDRLMDPMINQTMRGEVATLANLKAYLESHPS